MLDALLGMLGSGVVGLLVGLILQAKGTNILRWWRRKTVVTTGGVHRIALPDDETLFRDSFRVYDRLPSELRDDKAELRAWLTADVGDASTDELYLVCISQQQVCGMLYASIYKKRQSRSLKVSPRCVVWALVPKLGLDPPGATEVALKLWRYLENEVAGLEEGCEYFIEIADLEDAVGEPRDDWLRYLEEMSAFLRRIEAKRVCTDGYRIPDADDCREENETKAALYYKGERERSLDMGEVLEFMYGAAYFWDFLYGDEFVEWPELYKRFEYFESLRRRVLRQCGDSVALEGVVESVKHHA